MQHLEHEDAQQPETGWGGNLKKTLNMLKLAIKAARFMIHTLLLGQFEVVNREEIASTKHIKGV